MKQNWGSKNLVIVLLSFLIFNLMTIAISGCNVSGQAISFLNQPALEPATATPTFTLPPTLTPDLTPTITPTPDLTGTTIRLQDLPPGFEPVPEADLQKYNFTEASIAQSFSQIAIQARPRNLFVFSKKTPKVELVVGFVLYPLSSFERTIVDSSLSNPDSVLQALAAGFAIGGRSIKSSRIIPGMDKFGDRSVGVTALPSMDSPQLRMDVVVTRRGSIAEIVCLIYSDGSPPSFEIGTVALLLDSRVAISLGR